MPRDLSLSRRNARFHYPRPKLTLVHASIAHCIPRVMQMHPCITMSTKGRGICINHRNSRNAITQCTFPPIADISAKWYVRSQQKSREGKKMTSFYICCILSEIAGCSFSNRNSNGTAKKSAVDDI